MKKNNLWTKKNDEEIDAILPFMSLLLIIIPVLLSNLSFYQFRVIGVTTPGGGKDDSPPSEQKEEIKKEKMVTAYLELYKDKAKISFLDEETAEPISSQQEFLNDKGAEKLFSLLKKNKKDYPKLDNLMLKISKDLNYESIATFITHFKQPLLAEKEIAELKSKQTDPEKKEQIKSEINIVLLREFAQPPSIEPKTEQDKAPK